jgi:hypothetical protein
MDMDSHARLDFTLASISSGMYCECSIRRESR